MCGLTDSIIDFNKDSFENCSLKLVFRKEKNFKYNNITLTPEALDLIGYHSACYSKVTALKSKYNEEYTNFVKNHKVSTYKFYLNVMIFRQLIS